MLGLAEYRASSARLTFIANQYERDLAQWIDKDTTKAQAALLAKSMSVSYYEDFRRLLDDSLHEVAENAVNHYSELLGVEPDKDLAKAIVAKQYETPYWGATLMQRLAVNEIRLHRNATRSSQVSPDAVAGLLTKTIPFGAQVNIDRRVLLGTIAKVENDTARSIASTHDIRLVRWKLSHAHDRTDVCDDYAAYTDERVDQYIADNNIGISNKGIFFTDEVPPPPHPNCQCEYEFIGDDGAIQLGALRRTVKGISSLLRRIFGR